MCLGSEWLCLVGRDTHYPTGLGPVAGGGRVRPYDLLFPGPTHATTQSHFL